MLTIEHDLREFLAGVEEFLVRDEAENNLLFGILADLIEGGRYSEPPLLARVETAGKIAAVALRTPPFNLILSAIESDATIEFLARELHCANLDLPGVVGPSREARVFADNWCAITGSEYRRRFAQRIYRLDSVIPPRPVSGHLRTFAAADASLAGEWMAAFNRDIGEEEPAEPTAQLLRRFTVSPSRGVLFWEDEGRPVSMTGYSGPTPHGIRIAPVYTPPEFRSLGYASACVAAVSQRLLREGRKFCFLYTDLANPTSNRIYQAIGYRPVCDADVLRFHRRDS
jgi:uncharacterized protein